MVKLTVLFVDLLMSNYQVSNNLNVTLQMKGMRSGRAQFFFCFLSSSIKTTLLSKANSFGLTFCYVRTDVCHVWQVPLGL